MADFGENAKQNLLDDSEETEYSTDDDYEDDTNINFDIDGLKGVDDDWRSESEDDNDIIDVKRDPGNRQQYVLEDTAFIPGKLPIYFDISGLVDDDFLKEVEHDDIAAVVAIQKSFMENLTTSLEDTLHSKQREQKDIQAEKASMRRQKESGKQGRAAEIHDMQDQLEIKLSKAIKERQETHEKSHREIMDLEEKIRHRETTVRGVTNLDEGEVHFLKRDPHLATRKLIDHNRKEVEKLGRPTFRLNSKRIKFHKDMNELTDLTREHYHYHKHTVQHVHRHFYHDNQPLEPPKDSHYVQNKFTIKCGHTGAASEKEEILDDDGEKIEFPMEWEEYAKAFLLARDDEDEEALTLDNNEKIDPTVQKFMKKRLTKDEYAV